MYEQGDIILIPFPYSDLTGSKQRPALIISNDKINVGVDKICCLITTKPNENDILISKKDFQIGGLPFQSFIRAHRIFTIYEGIIKRRLGRITSRLHSKVIGKIIEYLKSEQ